jgi:hypothetical protein
MLRFADGVAEPDTNMTRHAGERAMKLLDEGEQDVANPLVRPRGSRGRRSWLGLLGGYAAALTLAAAEVRSQVRQQNPPPRPAGSDPAGGDDDEGAKLKAPTKGILEANEKDIKKRVERLLQLATELKAEVDRTDSSQVLSMAMVKKAEEIEKLAKEISSRAKG